MLAIEGVMPPQHPREFRVSGRAPSVDDDASDTLARFGSDQACLRHETTTAYRCFLPDLTGFAGRFCTGPDRQRRDAAAGSATPDLGRGFSPAGADCGYRAPLAPRLARPPRWYRRPVLRARSALGRPSGRSPQEQGRAEARYVGVRTNGLPCRAD